MAVMLLLNTPGCANTPDSTGRAGLPRSDRAALAVLNFRNTTEKEQAARFQPWEYGIATMLSTDLESLGVFNIVERERLRDIVREFELQSSDLVDSQTAVKVGRLVAADYLLTGSFSEMKGELRIAVQVFSVEKGVQLGAASIQGETETFFTMEKKLFIEVIDFLEVMMNEEDRTRIATEAETRSVDASLMNYSGEMALSRAREMKRTGRNQDAVRLLQEARKNFSAALAYDPAYARARKNLETLAMAIPITL
jgi:TolB-like protein